MYLKRITFLEEPEIVERLEELAKQGIEKGINMTLSDVIRMLIRKGLGGQAQSGSLDSRRED